MSNAERIFMRYAPCRCGCKGSDHRRTISRKVQEIVEIPIDESVIGRTEIENYVELVKAVGRVRYNGEDILVGYVPYQTGNTKQGRWRWIADRSDVSEPIEVLR